MESALSEIESAAVLVAMHGSAARQKVVDRIVAAIRENDVERAKTWDRIGALVDNKLGITSLAA